MNQGLIYAVWSAIAGALIPVMAASTGTLGRSIGSPFHASLASILAAAALVFAVFLWARPAMPGGAALAAAPWWSWIGGAAVGFYTISAAFLAPRFGVGNFIMCVVVAQLVMSSCIDQFGLFGAPHHLIDLKRALGLAALAAGAALVAAK